MDILLMINVTYMYISFTLKQRFAFLCKYFRIHWCTCVSGRCTSCWYGIVDELEVWKHIPNGVSTRHYLQAIWIRVRQTDTRFFFCRCSCASSGKPVKSITFVNIYDPPNPSFSLCHFFTIISYHWCFYSLARLSSAVLLLMQIWYHPFGATRA